MPWLDSSYDEVASFHPAFEVAANEALRMIGRDGDLEWVHHARSITNNLIPDFVLVRRATRRWLAAVEIKRSQAAVYSARFQSQAKSYAEHNAVEFDANTPRFYALSNLEDTVVFALEGERAPYECVILGGRYQSGRFNVTPDRQHQDNLRRDVAALIELVARQEPPQFDRVWPSVILDFLTAVRDLVEPAGLALPQPVSAGWNIVHAYFGIPLEDHKRYVFVFQCLIVEYLRGLLARVRHPDAARVPALIADRPETVAQAIGVLSSIDFEGVFADGAADLYGRDLEADLRAQLHAFIDTISSGPRRVFDLAARRLDTPELVETLFTASFPLSNQDEYGKIQTDPELAAIVAAICIRNPTATVLDPGCGEGTLLSAAMDELMRRGRTFEQALHQVRGIEADGVATRLAVLKLVLKDPAAVHPAIRAAVAYGDVFASAASIAAADVVLMNPPFKRYEAQDARPVPAELRAHYASAIEALTGQAATTISGQANLYNYYVEFVGRCARPGAIIGIILDNRWYHSKYGTDLREFLLETFAIEAILEYPHWSFFSAWTIATSIVVLRKGADPSTNRVRFIRCKTDPRELDLVELRNALGEGAPIPLELSANEVPQSELDSAVGWKGRFRQELTNEYRAADWPTATLLFEGTRRGSLQKEGGGIDVLEFPFNRTTFGYRRARGNGHAFNTGRGPRLTNAENEELRLLASAIPDQFRGYALKNADDLSGYEVTSQDCSINQTLESPLLRASPALFSGQARAGWSAAFETAIEELHSDPAMHRFIGGVERISHLTSALLPDNERWVGLREPYAGELVIPRKARIGHRVHINPFAFSNGRQVRVSSNFITMSGCRAVDLLSGLTRDTATRLIAAFLLSSFGQLQFEIEGYNREGVLSLEKHHLENIKIFDPRWIPVADRDAILAAYQALPYPLDSRRLSSDQPERNALDTLFANLIAQRHPALQPAALLAEVHAELDDWLVARQP